MAYCAYKGTDCDLAACQGGQDDSQCEREAQAAYWLTLTPDEQTEILFADINSAPMTATQVRARDQVALPLVLICPDRGSVLPVSIQAECGCGELTECRAARGTYPGRVTLRDCIECRLAPTS